MISTATHPLRFPNGLPATKIIKLADYETGKLVDIGNFLDWSGGVVCRKPGTGWSAIHIDGNITDLWCFRCGGSISVNSADLLGSFLHCNMCLARTRLVQLSLFHVFLEVEEI
jgi:hypothetical protein